MGVSAFLDDIAQWALKFRNAAEEERVRIVAARFYTGSLAWSLEGHDEDGGIRQTLHSALERGVDSKLIAHAQTVLFPEGDPGPVPLAAASAAEGTTRSRKGRANNHNSKRKAKARGGSSSAAAASSSAAATASSASSSAAATASSASSSAAATTASASASSSSASTASVAAAESTVDSKHKSADTPSASSTAATSEGPQTDTAATPASAPSAVAKEAAQAMDWGLQSQMRALIAQHSLTNADILSQAKLTAGEKVLPSPVRFGGCAFPSFLF